MYNASGKNHVVPVIFSHTDRSSCKISSFIAVWRMENRMSLRAYSVTHLRIILWCTDRLTKFLFKKFLVFLFYPDTYLGVTFFHCKSKLDTLFSSFQPTEDQDYLRNGIFLHGFCRKDLQLVLQQQARPYHDIGKEISDFSEL